MDLKYILKIFIVVFLILSLIAFINSIGLNLNQSEQPKKLLDVVTVKVALPLVEGLDNQIPTSGSKAFCDIHSGFDLEQSCQKLTKNNCGLTSCCVWTSDDKCKAGNKSGPLFNSDSKGKTKPLDYYYFQNQCYGEKCPKN
jgi:hypothetical protein